jgi:ribosomal-protein-alanine N-acetyltransferase
MPNAFRRHTDSFAPAAEPERAGLPTLDGERLRLRWMQSGDLPDLARLFNDHGASRAWNHGAGGDHGEASIYLESVQRGHEIGHQFQWGIALLDDDRVIGTATLYGIDHLQGRAELGFALARDHCGKRYAREALSVLLDHAFGTLQLRRVEADVDPRSLAALRTLENLGFRREGYLRQRWRIGSEMQDSVLMGMLAADWPRRG